MLKLYRNIFAAGVISLGLAACGDDVTVTPPPPPPPPPTPGVNSVTVSPAAQTINVGQTVVFAAAVQADAGITNTGVDWSSSNSAIATVDAVTGAVKGIAPGATTIIAKSKQDATRIGVSTVTVVALPPGVTSFTPNFSNYTLSVGQSVTAGINAVYAAGVTPPAITWSSLNTLVASVGNTSGVISAQAPGTAVVRASATLPADPTRGTAAQTVTADILVTVLAAPSLSIESITQAAFTVPVDISNVMGQIEVTLNFNPREQSIDSVVVYLDEAGVPKFANKQVFTGVPAAGLIRLSIQTDAYSKNPAAGTTTVAWHNGATTVRAAIWRTSSTGVVGGVSALNCSLNPGFPVCSTPVQLFLNNADGWVADITKPTSLALSPFGITYWGGPSATGGTTAELYSVIYTQNRDIQSVNWTLGTASSGNTCSVSAEAAFNVATNITTTRPWIRKFGYTAAPQSANLACNREWNGGGLGDRDNVIVINAIDNFSNPFVTTLIPNAVLNGSTPDSLRMDYRFTSMTAPNINRSAPQVNAWLNNKFNLLTSPLAGDFDVGVGRRTVPDVSATVGAPICAGASTGIVQGTTTGVTTTVLTIGGGNTNALAECPVNFIGGISAQNIANLGPFNIFAQESDRLGNIGTSGLAVAAAGNTTFGVDNTVPQIRPGIVDASLGLTTAAYGCSTATGVCQADPVDSIRVGSKVGAPSIAFGTFRAEYLDERSGFYNAGQPDGGGNAAQSHSLSTAAHINPLGLCLIGAGPIGATFVTAPGCSFAPITVGTPGVTTYGWQPGQNLLMPAAEGYYAYRTWVQDAAGNQSPTILRRALINAVAPTATGLGVLATLTNAAFNFTPTFSDSAEVARQSLQLVYPNLAFGATTTDSARYSRTTLVLSGQPNCVGFVLAAFMDNCISSPFSGSISPVFSPATPYVRAIENVNAGVFPASNIDAVSAPTSKPTKATAWAWNWGNFSTASPEAPLPPLNVENGATLVGYNTANPSNNVIHWRIIPNFTVSNFFGSIVPLRAQVVAPTSSPNPPFVRVDFYRLNTAGNVPSTVLPGVYWSYLGSAGTTFTCTGLGVCASDQGTYRSWTYQLPTASYVTDWIGGAQTATFTTANRYIAVGVLPNGDAVVTAITAVP